MGALRDYQKQLDPDGIEVGVSRQALDEVLFRGMDIRRCVAAAHRIWLWILRGWPADGKCLRKRGNEKGLRRSL